MSSGAVSFGPFLLLPEQRLLLEGDRQVRLGNRAFDILVCLVDRAGELVSKEELMARVWPQAFIGETSLKIQVHMLRRALGDGQGGNRYIHTTIGRGYAFVAPIRIEMPARATVAPTIARSAPHNLPLATTRVIGREEAVEVLVSRLSQQRLVTVTGPGGIGKTTAALAVAEQMVPEYEDGVWQVDLASLRDARLVPSAVGTVLGVQIRAADPIHGLVAALRDNRMLLVLDNCEHLIDEVANLVNSLLSRTQNVGILATSREPLRLAGGSEYRLAPLGGPQGLFKLTAAEAMTFPVVQLFVERVAAIVEDFALTDDNAPLVVEVCRKLDGLPLAIEFAAPYVGVLGVNGLATRLDKNLPLLKSHSRGRVARHRTMRAVIDWSYNLLDQEQQVFFRALGILSGSFTVEAAAAVAIEQATTDIEAIDCLADLVTKSLVAADVSGVKARFRLLDTTRAYAMEKLGTSKVREPIARRHAEYYRQYFARAEVEALGRTTGEWLADYARDIDNLRAALDWAFSPGGDASIGVELTTAALPLWIHMSLLEECRSRVKQALGALGSAATKDLRKTMRLHAALGVSTPEYSEIGDAFTTVLDMARRLDDVEYQLRALRGLYLHHVGYGRFRLAHPIAQEFHALTSRGSDRNDFMFGERMMATSEHYVGKQASARRRLELVLAQDAVSNDERDVFRLRDVVRYGADLHVSTRVFLARVLWLQGFADQAVREVERCLNEAEAIGHAISQCYVLGLAACPISLWVGDQAAATRYITMLVDLSRRHALPFWTSHGARHERALLIKAGGPERASRMRPNGHDDGVDPNSSFRSLTTLMPLGEALGQAGRIAEGLALLEVGIEQFEDNCFTPEIMRLKGELTLLQGMPDATRSAEASFRQAVDGAREHGTLSWELRAATSLARLIRCQGRAAEATACLRPIYDQFTEGFGTADLIVAKQLLDELGA